MPVLLTRKEAAARLGVSLPTLDAERSTGHLAYIQRKPGGKVWIKEQAVIFRDWAATTIFEEGV